MSESNPHYIVDCSEVRSPSEFWTTYLRVVKPDGAGFFGRNLDAFWDALSGGGPGYPGKCTLEFHATGTLELAGHRDFLQRLETIGNKLADSPHDGITVVIRS